MKVKSLSTLIALFMLYFMTIEITQKMSRQQKSQYQHFYMHSFAMGLIHLPNLLVKVLIDD
jgi:hypothetical protein